MYERGAPIVGPNLLAGHVTHVAGRPTRRCTRQFPRGILVLGVGVLHITHVSEVADAFARAKREQQETVESFALKSGTRQG